MKSCQSGNINKKSIAKLRKFANPPTTISVTFSAICLLLNEPENNWTYAKQFLLADFDQLINKMMNVTSCSSIPLAKHIVEMFNINHISNSSCHETSHTTGYFHKWIEILVSNILELRMGEYPIHETNSIEIIHALKSRGANFSNRDSVSLKYTIMLSCYIFICCAVCIVCMYVRLSK